MHHLSRRSLLQCLALSQVALWAPAALASNGWRSLAFDRLSQIVDTRVKSRQAVGISIGISAPRFRKMSHFGVENLTTRKAVSPTTQFRIASITKPVTAACILDLCDQGRLSLDTPIDQFFPDFPHAEDITVYQLLTHTSGLANWWGRLANNVPADFMDRPSPHRVLMQMDEPFLFAPGTMRSYSNSGYVLLGEIIEIVTDVEYSEWLKRNLLMRCGASGISLERTGTMQDGWATGYMLDDRDIQAVFGTPMPFAAGGLRSNIHDILAFSDALFHGKLLQPQSLECMVTQATVTDGRLVQDAMYDSPEAPAEAWPSNVTEFGYGLGINTWVQSGERFYSHSGLIDGFSAYLIHAPRTLTTVAVLSNSQAGATDLGQPIRDMLIAAEVR